MKYYALMLGVGWAIQSIKISTKEHQGAFVLLVGFLLATTVNILSVAVMAWAVIHLLQYLR